MASYLSALLPLSIFTIVFWFLWTIVEAYFVSPLRRVPGPFWGRVSSWWLLFIDFAGDRTATIHQLHKQYGDVVCVGPKEISLANVESVKDVYGQGSQFIKARIYEYLSEPPLGIFSMRNRQHHSQRRRLLSHAFSQGNLLESEPLILSQVRLVLETLRSAKQKPTNAIFLFRMFALDVVGELFFGKSFGALVSGEAPQFLHDLDNFMLVGAMKGNFPTAFAIASRLPVPSLQHFLHSFDRMSEYGKKCFYDYIAANGRESQRKDLLTKILSPAANEKHDRMTDLEIYLEISNLVFGGTDTTSTTLTYLFWELAKNPLWQTKVKQEVIKDHSGDVLEYRDVANLPLLGAVIDETLRLHPAVPASLPRDTPPGGRMLGGHFIPAGTVVSMQCYTTQRHPRVWQAPDSWIPDRWLTEEVTDTAAKELFMPFSKGSRACLGKNLASMELRLLTANILAKFEVKLEASATDECMSIKDHFLLLPKGGKCELIFSPVA